MRRNKLKSVRSRDANENTFACRSLRLNRTRREDHVIANVIRFALRTGWAFVATIIALGWVGPAEAQIARQLQPFQIMINGRGIRNGAVQPQGDDTAVDSIGAVLKTDPELEEILEQAERIRNDGNYRVATQLWQAVLRRSGDALYSSDGSTYFSMVRQVEGILAGLPEEGLAAYRVLADGAAKEILAQAAGPSDVVALNQVVREYFISSIGDDAAFDLGCVYLDQYDFIGARRMFEKIATQYPDTSIPLDEIYSRIALCHTFLGDLKSATEALAQASQYNPNSQRVKWVRQAIDQLIAGDTSLSDWAENHLDNSSDWMMRMGSSRRYGIMPAVPDAMMDNDLVATWQFYFQPREVYGKAADVRGGMLSGSRAFDREVADTQSSMEERLIESWREKSWRPAGHLLIDGDRVVFKTGSDLSVWSREKINKASKESANRSVLDDAIDWRSVWNNSFEIDDATRMNRQLFNRYQQMIPNSDGTGKSPFPYPTSISEVQLFGDEIYQQMSIVGDRLYSIEGKTFDDKNRYVAKKLSDRWDASYRRSRTNFLTAYDVTTGRIQWQLPRESQQQGGPPDEEEPPWLDAGGFMSAPIGYADMILVPVNHSGAISIYALDPNQQGKTIWKSFLCDEPEAGSVPWASIDLSIEGSDLFVSCGMGVVFVMDPSTGLIRFAKRYQRVGKPHQLAQQMTWSAQRVEFEGWSDDVVIPYGRQMICFCSDTDSIESFDRNSGELIWRSEMNPIGFKVDYLLGVQGSMLYAAGNETIVAYDLEGEGRMVWGADQIFEGKQSLGRGMLTSKGIYMPVEDNIYLYDLLGDNGKAKTLSKVHVELGTGAPLGNLYSDGERFWVHGANRLYALDIKPD